MLHIIWPSWMSSLKDVVHPPPSHGGIGVMGSGGVKGAILEYFVHHSEMWILVKKQQTKHINFCTRNVFLLFYLCPILRSIGYEERKLAK